MTHDPRSYLPFCMLYPFQRTQHGVVSRPRTLFRTGLRTKKNAPALFQEMMSQVLCLVKKRPAVQELLKRGAVLEAHIDDVLLGTNSVEDHLVLLSEFFEVCQEQHLRIKLEKCEFLRTEMEYLGFTIGPGWWKPRDAKLRPLLYFDLSEVSGNA